MPAPTMIWHLAHTHTAARRGAGDIFLNLHKLVGKTLVGRSLEALATDERINERIYGKQKIYFPLQVGWLPVS